MTCIEAQASPTATVQPLFSYVGNVTKTVAGSVITNYPAHDADNRRSLTRNEQIGGQSYPFAYAYPSGRVLNASYDPALRPTRLTGSAGGVAIPYVQQVGFFPHGGIFYWQYGNAAWPVESYPQLLQRWIQYTALANCNSQLLLYTQNIRTRNGTVGSGVECYRAPVPSP